MTNDKPFAAALLAFAAAPAQARGTANQTKATLAGAAAGAALGGALGGDGQSILLGAAAGGLAGNAYAYHNKKMNRADEEIEHGRRYREWRGRDRDFRRRHDDFRREGFRPHHGRHHPDWD
ncbi:glycine zipper domain-containing protein [Neisseria bacilliformis]|uniref:glycine zipper domain-containing protein n=1 Tax=Neisseria bacilliformis TaxID=267212 RepID=UPI000666BC7C|nr:glycine zipper domain-containing protein [Neisseria bacilliformis]